MSGRFEDWLSNELTDLRMRAACSVPNGFPKDVWNWEFNEEFERYLPAYMNMLVEVDAMDDCLEYYRMKEQARLHEEFDNYLASGTLDHRMNEFIDSKFLQDDFVHKVAVSDLRMIHLQHWNLISLKCPLRAKLVEWERQLASYSQCLASLMKNDEMKGKLTTLMNSLNEEGFFIVDSMDWGNTLFSDSIEKFNELVFFGQCMDKCLVIRGIMDYHKILQLKDVDWQDAFKMVISNTNYWWKENLQKFWVSTRHYKHAYYDTLAQPLQKVYLLHGAPKPKYC